MSSKSTIPTSCTQTESTVLDAPIDKVWAKFRGFAFEGLAPGQVASTSYESGGEGQCGSIIKVVYNDADKTVWKLRIIEFSERKYTIAYELLSAEPAHNATSVQGEIKLLSVTTDQTTFVSWTTEFSNDADLVVISDQKYKKQEFFKDAKSNL